MASLREEVEAAGRTQIPQAVQVRLDITRVDKDSIAAYEQAGVTELVMHVASSNVAKQAAAIEAFASDMIN